MKAFVIVPLGLALAALVDVQSQTTLREDRIVRVGSMQEHWLLEWRRQPEAVCSPQSPEWFTCPCQGFAFGEIGVLDLVRRRPGHSDETLPLTPLFADGENPATQRVVNAAVLQRWPVLSSDKIDDHSAAFEQQVHTRPVVRAMQFGDYDHDGRATEFMLLVSSTPCGHNAAVVVGISRKQPTLHALTSIAHPERPLMLETALWNSLLHSQGLVNAPEVRCGDHGAEEQTDVRLTVSDRGIDAARLVFDCTADGRKGALKSTQAF